MNEIVKSKGIIAFFIFVIVMALINSNIVNKQKNIVATNNDNVVNHIQK